MSGALDDLREMVAWKFNNGTPNNGDMQETIVDFEHAHPGLVDQTEKCRRCPAVIDGAVLAKTLASEMTWVWSNEDRGYLCPACAKAGNVTP